MRVHILYFDPKLSVRIPFYLDNKKILFHKKIYVIFLHTSVAGVLVVASRYYVENSQGFSNAIVQLMYIKYIKYLLC